MKEVMPEPSEEQWTAIGEHFWNIWNFPNCIGAVDEKHVNIEAPANSGSVYFNYKKTFSVILFALVDANYNFIMIDVGSSGRSSDGGIFSHSAPRKHMENGSLNILPDSCLPGTNIEAPFVIVGDEAFPLKTYLMRPYPGRQSSGNDFMTYCNNRLSRARRLSENAFGTLAQKFIIILRTIKSPPENVDCITSAACVLQNFITQRNDKSANQTNTITDETSGTAQILNYLPLQGGRATDNVFAIREIFKDYFSSSVGRIVPADNNV